MKDAHWVIDEGVQKLRETINNTYRQKVLNWLSPIDHDSEQSDSFALRQENTGQWFLESDGFLKWLNGQSKTLLCQGIPGAGKTVMTAIIVHHLHQQFSKADNIGIAYVYGSVLRQSEQHLQAILSSLLKQLSQPLPELPECMTEVYEQFWTHHIYPSPEKLLQMLGTLMTSREKTFVIVDALDEIKASDGTCRQLLIALFRLQQSVPVSFIATSRHVADIASMFRRNRSDLIEIRALDDDVRSYIDGQMNKARPFVSEDQKLRSKVKEMIVQAVDGMFLLAKLHMDSLRDKVSKGDVNIKCNGGELPLEIAYHREGVSSKDREAVINILLEHNAAAATTGITDVRCSNMVIEWARRNHREDIIDMMKETPPELQNALLLSASHEGRLKEVQHLFEAGANPDYRDPPWGRSPLSQAAEYDQTAVVSYLLNKGVNPDMHDTKGYMDAQDNTDKTPLMWAAMTGAVGPFRVLLEHGADPNKENGRTEIIKILLERGLEPDVHDYFQQTPLFWAARRGHLRTGGGTSAGTWG
ncbi:hypothetical protein DTO212C5_3843 [Paecilomyces variotii]|nr:hypothetical protein DTO212C5_3843 [Paecilomyces variotii]